MVSGLFAIIACFFGLAIAQFPGHNDGTAWGAWTQSSDCAAQPASTVPTTTPIVFSTPAAAIPAIETSTKTALMTTTNSFTTTPTFATFLAANSTTSFSLPATLVPAVSTSIPAFFTNLVPGNSTSASTITMVSTNSTTPFQATTIPPTSLVAIPSTGASTTTPSTSTFTGAATNLGPAFSVGMGMAVMALIYPVV